MLSGLLRRRAGRGARRNALSAIPYRLECACGKALTGERSAKAVTVRCPACKTEALVFPTSPLSQLRATLREALRNGPPKNPPPQTAVRLAYWRKPLVAAGATLVIIIAGFIILLNSSLFRSVPSPEIGPEDESFREEIAAGRRALADQAFAKAVEHFQRARWALETRGDETSARTARWLAQLEKEAALLADTTLLSESLQEILQRLSGPAWQDHFRNRYQDKAIIFDAAVHDVGAGVFRIDYPLHVTGRPAHVEINNSAALRALKIEWPARLLIGVRLAEARKDARGNWLVLARPDSIVLFTDAAMFRGLSVPVDADLIEQLKKQAALMDIAPP